MAMEPFDYGGAMPTDETAEGAEMGGGTPATPEQIGKCLFAVENKLFGKSSFNESGLYVGGEDYSEPEMAEESEPMEEDQVPSGLTA